MAPNEVDPTHSTSDHFNATVKVTAAITRISDCPECAPPPALNLKHRHRLGYGMGGRPEKTLGSRVASGKIKINIIH